MSIKQYISDLLFFYDVVIIPDFGGFAANYRPAEINNNSFLPPFKDIMFNADLKTNDGILISSIVKNEGLEQQQAIAKIREFTLQTQNSLQAKKTVVFDGVGSLRLGKENKIIFEPDNSVNYLLDAYGLASFNSPLVNADELSLKNKEAFKSLLVHRYTKRLAVGLPLALALMFIPLKSNYIKNFSSLNIFPSYTSEQPLNYNNVAENSSSVEGAIDELTKNKTALYFNTINEEKLVEESLEKITENAEAEPIVEEKIVIKEEPVVEIVVEKTSQRYCLITGSFSTKSNAKKQVKKLKNLGLDAEILEKNGKYRVAAQAFENRNDAKQKAKEIKKLHKISSWIFDKK